MIEDAFWPGLRSRVAGSDPGYGPKRSFSDFLSSYWQKCVQHNPIGPSSLLEMNQIVLDGSAVLKLSLGDESSRLSKIAFGGAWA